MNIDHDNRVELFRQSSNFVSDGEVIRCSGLDDKKQCSSPYALIYFDCTACEAVDILSTHFKYIELIGPGLIKLTEKGIQEKERYYYYERFLRRNQIASLLKGTKDHQKQISKLMPLYSSVLLDLGNMLGGRVKLEDQNNSQVKVLVNSVIDDTLKITKIRNEIENSPRKK